MACEVCDGGQEGGEGGERGGDYCLEEVHWARGEEEAGREAREAEALF